MLDLAIMIIKQNDLKQRVNIFLVLVCLRHPQKWIQAHFLYTCQKQLCNKDVAKKGCPYLYAS